MKEEEKQKQQQEYNEYVKQVTPTRNLAWAMCRAFIVGGLICIIGQLILNTAVRMGLDKEMAGSWCSLCLIFLSIVLTGFNIYPSFKQCGGAGDRVSERRTGIWNWRKDLYDRRAGDFVWDFFKLGIGAWVLDRKGIRNFLTARYVTANETQTGRAAEWNRCSWRLCLV